MKFTVGIPKEQKIGEKRVVLTPDVINELKSIYPEVNFLVEKNAGVGAGFQNEDYLSGGQCEIVDSAKDLWQRSDMVVKVKEPQESEYEFLKENQLLFTFLHLASCPQLVTQLKNKKVASIAFELVRDRTGAFPILLPMSEVAGTLAVQNGVHFLLAHQQGKGILLGGVSGVRKGKVVIIGGGTAGVAACRAAVGLGARVVVFERDPVRIRQLESDFGGTCEILYSSKDLIEREVRSADLLISTVLIPGEAAPKIVSRDMIKSMQDGSVYVDVSIDQGGAGETIKPTSLDSPVYIEEGVLHYGVTNMPAQAPRTASLALSTALSPYMIKLIGSAIQAKGDLNSIIRGIPENLRTAVSSLDGELTCGRSASSLKLDFKDVNDII